MDKIYVVTPVLMDMCCQFFTINAINIRTYIFMPMYKWFYTRDSWVKEYGPFIILCKKNVTYCNR